MLQQVETVQEIYKQDKMVLKFKLKELTNLLLLFCSVLCFSQNAPNLEGQYYFENNKAEVTIYDKNHFFAVGYNSAVLGKVEIIDKKVYFKADHPKSEILLYGRKSEEKSEIILDGHIFNNDVYFGTSTKKEDQIILSPLKQETSNYCQSDKYFMAFAKMPYQLSFNVDDDSTSFKINNFYDHFFPVFLKKDADLSFLNGQITIENGVMKMDQSISKQKLNLSEELKKMIAEIEMVDSVFDEDFIFLNSGYNIISKDKIDLNKYTYTKENNEYISKTKLQGSEAVLNTVYKFNKIKQVSKSSDQFKLNDSYFKNIKCLPSSESLMNSGKNIEPKVNLQKTVEIKPMK